MVLVGKLGVLSIYLSIDDGSWGNQGALAESGALLALLCNAPSITRVLLSAKAEALHPPGISHALRPSKLVSVTSSLGGRILVSSHNLLRILKYSAFRRCILICGSGGIRTHGARGLRISNPVQLATMRRFLFKPSLMWFAILH